MLITFKKSCTFIILFLISNICLAQTYLAFDKPGIVKRVRFYKGDQISIKTAQTEGFINDEILDIRNPNIEFSDGSIIQIDSITHIRVKNSNGFAKFRGVLSYVLITSGIGYFVIDAFNNSIDGNPVLDEGTVAISGSFVAVGLLIRPWGRRIHKIQNNKRLFIIDMDKGIEEIENN